MAAMASKFNFECVIQYYTDQWIDLFDESDEEIQRVLQEKDAENTKKSTKFAIQAFGDLQTAEESVKNLYKRLARFFCKLFFYVLH